MNEVASFNLTTAPWILVIEKKTNKRRMVSLIKLFENAQNYQQLAGDMRIQDLSILRLLLAILTTVYSRYDVDGHPYEWINDDPISQKNLNVKQKKYRTDLLVTWRKLYQQGHFSKVITRYLTQMADCFNLCGPHPFYQVSKTTFDSFVVGRQRISSGKDNGVIAVRQLNRQISESGNSKAFFSPKSEAFKDQASLDELTRWLITYQNYNSKTDKSKIKTKERFSVSEGWLYRLGTIYADGSSLFETLMLNLVLYGDDIPIRPQRPVWEYPDDHLYVEESKRLLKPDNLASLYTNWSRMMHIEWSDQGTPKIFGAGIPTFSADNTYIEPMTTWYRNEKAKKDLPGNLQRQGVMMWRHFGGYVDSIVDRSNRHVPGIVRWLSELKNKQILTREKPLILATTRLIPKDKYAMPGFEYHDNLQMVVGVIFDEENYWPRRIKDAIEIAQQVGLAYETLTYKIAKIRRVEKTSFTTGLNNQFYSSLNAPFNNWLKSLRETESSRDEKTREWHATLRRIADKKAQEIFLSSTTLDMVGYEDSKKDDQIENVFTAMNSFRIRVAKLFE